MSGPNLKERPHCRFNPLTREWILVSPHRTQRPWQGQIEKIAQPAAVEYDPECYLCPRNTRAGGRTNPDYTGTYVFENDYPALLPGPATGGEDESGLLVARPETGTTRVLCFSPRHDLTLATMERPALRQVVDMWADEYQGLAAIDDVRYVQIFENRGSMMGASNPHPHGQIWASSSIPNEPAREQASLAEARPRGGACLLCDYAELELAKKERVVFENHHFVVVVPFWAVWPFETMVLPRRHAGAIPDLTDVERDALADALKRVTTRYDNVFGISFPYSMGFHQRPTDGLPHDEWHLHAHFYPPLLRSATVRKFMVGYEMLGSPQRDITAETAAERLRQMSETHQ